MNKLSLILPFLIFIQFKFVNGQNLFYKVDKSCKDLKWKLSDVYLNGSGGNRLFLGYKIEIKAKSGIYEYIADCVDESLIDNITCRFNYDPVCGCNGVTYENSCYAEHHGGILKYGNGECTGSEKVIFTIEDEFEIGEELIVNIWTNINGKYKLAKEYKINSPICESCQYKDSINLVKLYNSLSGINWTLKTNWLDSRIPIKNWYGITVNPKGCVDSIILQNNNLKGNLNNYRFLELQNLNLASNQIEGMIPDFDSLPMLKKLNLKMNKLDSFIPVFTKLDSLQLLDLSFNQLKGCIPQIYKSWCKPSIKKAIFTSNSQLPWQGNNDSFCLKPTMQINAPCDDGDNNTTSDEIDISCNCKGTSILSCRYKDSIELIKLYNSLNGPNWLNNTNWKVVGKPINKWYGIKLNSEGCVLSITLNNNNLNGQLPNLEFSKLEDLVLYSNKISGQIPFLNLKNLKQLYLSDNLLSGNIPYNYFPVIKEIRFFKNNLSGCFADSLYEYCKAFCEFDENPLLPWKGNFLKFCQDSLQIGAVCDDGDSTTIYDKIDSNCNCNGTINSCRYKDSLELIKFYNHFEGSNWTNKWDFKQSVDKWYGIRLGSNNCVIDIELNNNNLKGDIYNFEFKELQILDLSRNLLKSSIPNFDKLPNLIFLDLGFNQLSGEIPYFNKLPNLIGIHLNNNLLTGCYPDSLKSICKNKNNNFLNNPKLPWQGDIEKFCQDSAQIGAPCLDGDPKTLNDRINDDCSCGKHCTNTNRNLDTTICQGIFIYKNVTYFQNTLIRDSFQTSKGCDSIINIDLKFIPPTKTVLDTSICEGSSIVIAGKRYQSSMRDTIQFSSSLGCDSTIYLNIQAEALPVADVGLDQFIPCNQAFVTLKAASAGQGLSYLWKDSTGVIISTQDSVRIANAGLYILELKNKMGCSDLDSIYVSASDKPVIDIVSTIPPFCTGGSSGSISINQVTKGLTPYRYSLYQNNQAIITLPLGTVFNDLASGSYEVEVRDANNCLTRQTVILPDPDPATIQIYLDTSGLQNQKAGIPLLLQTSLFNKVQGRVSYTWTIDRKEICVTNCSSQLSHSFEKSAWVRVCSEDSQCSSCDSSYILIHEEKKTNDPDIITDESDGFKFKDLDDPTINGTELWIATRTGTIVYNRKNYQCCNNTDLWKGQNQDGSKLPTASYYYVFKIHYGTNKKDEIRKGTVTWIK